MNVLADLVSRLAYPEFARKAVTELTEFQLCCTDELMGFCRSVVGDIGEENFKVQEESGHYVNVEDKKKSVEVL